MFDAISSYFSDDFAGSGNPGTVPVRGAHALAAPNRTEISGL